MRRFTVSLPDDQYRNLRDIAKDHRPALSLQYVVQFAIAHFLESTEDPQLRLQLADPTQRRQKRSE